MQNDELEFSSVCLVNILGEVVIMTTSMSLSRWWVLFRVYWLAGGSGDAVVLAALTNYSEQGG